MDKKQKRTLGNIALGILVLAAVVTLGVALKMYLAKIDAEEKKILEKTDTTYSSKKGEVSYTGFYVANVKEEIFKFILNRDISTLTYKFDGEPFYIELALEEDKDGETILTITKIVNEEKDISARMDMKNIESLEYRTGNSNEASVLKINTTYSSDYFVMTDGTYYFLGDDIESISYMNEQFYYTTYNREYLYLEEEKSCSKEVRAKMDGFNMKDYYYRYGKINFLDYYQKLASKTYTVANKCSEFES